MHFIFFCYNMKEFPLNKNYSIDLSGNVYNKKGHQLSFFYDRKDYKRIALPNRKYYVHRMMGITYLPNPDNKPIIDHIDGNTQNNCLHNLRWATYSENACNKRPSTKYIEPNIYKYIKGYHCIMIKDSIKYQNYCNTLEEAREYKKRIIDGTNTAINIVTNAI